MVVFVEESLRGPKPAADLGQRGEQIDADGGIAQPFRQRQGERAVRRVREAVLMDL